MIQLIFAMLMSFSHPAEAKMGGSGGTSGGNPKPVSAVPFNQDAARATKMAEAVALLKERLPKNCFPKDYNLAMIAELDLLVDTNNLFYFPETVVLGSDRYAGDYSQTILQNGNRQFFKVGAFTEKRKGEPIFFTRDSDNYDVEELAMTFAQDLNDHILQWSNETQLNAVGAMAMGKTACVANEYGANKVFQQFPEKDPFFEGRKRSFLEFLISQKDKDGSIAFGEYKEFHMEDIVESRDGVRFKFTGHTRYVNGKPITLPVKDSPLLEIVLSPFKIVRSGTNVTTEQNLGGFIREPESGTILTEFLFDRANRKLNMDTACDYREWEENDGTRVRLNYMQYNYPGGRRLPCEIKDVNGFYELKLNRSRGEICTQEDGRDLFNLTKSIDDISKETFCRNGKPNEFTVNDYERIVGTRDPDRFVEELETVNSMYYRWKYEVNRARIPWIRKQVLGGRIKVLPNFLSIVRDDKKGDVYSVTVSSSGFFIMTDRVESDDDDHDNSYQCFFQGPLAGKCARQYWDD